MDVNQLTQTFRSGHVLALQHTPGSSRSTSIWHRDPTGHWTVYKNGPLAHARTREHITCPIHVEWTGPSHLQVSAAGKGGLFWAIELGESEDGRLTIRRSRAFIAGAGLGAIEPAAFEMPRQVPVAYECGCFA